MSPKAQTKTTKKSPPFGSKKARKKPFSTTKNPAKKKPIRVKKAAGRKTTQKTGIVNSKNLAKELDLLEKRELKVKEFQKICNEIIKETGSLKVEKIEFSLENHGSPELRNKVQKLISDIQRSYKDTQKNIIKIMTIRQWVLYGIYDQPSSSFKARGRLSMNLSMSLTPPTAAELSQAGKPVEPGVGAGPAAPAMQERTAQLSPVQREIVDYFDYSLAIVEARNLRLFNALFAIRGSIYKNL